ncbi:precorrin-6Y C5,15-methyltransferase (decarboxylating) subunit CbiT [Clostridium sp. UBA5119]|uniref:precorrin-6Y C5,15-methyltransferase (decarboxylating) subunit CbiT n=1 Tax=Clostridium sp. UBA5119 TaxID=1946366 RepID=UPI003216608C
MKYIKDEEFIRGNCPMTKEEVRVLSVAKLNLEENSKLLDVGAGTGSISIQGSKICIKGSVVAIERDEGALEVIYKNKDKFNCNNLEVIEGEALEALNSIKEKFNSIFIGGSGGNLEKIIEKCHNLLEDDGVMVLNFITIDNVYKAMSTLKELNVKISCTQVGVSKTRGQSYMLFGYNPIFIVEAYKN